MDLKKLHAPGLSAALAAALVLCVNGPAQAETRWDGFSAETPNFNFLDFETQAKQPNTLRDRGIQSDFNEEDSFEQDFKTETFRDRVRKTLTTFDRNR